MRRLPLLVACLMTTAPLTAALAAPPEAPDKIFQGRDLFGLQYATDPQIRPDGRAVAYERHGFDIMTDRGHSSIWLIDVESGTQTPLIAGPGSHGSPRWSPKGDRLAYVSSAEDGRPQLFVRWMQNGQTAKLAELLDAPDSLTWSPDGKWIAFTMFAPDSRPPLGEAPPKPENAQWAPPLEVITDITYRADGAGYLKPGYTHVYVIAADGGAPRQLTFGAFNESGPLSWAPDGSYVVATGNRNENWRREPVNTELYRISLADGQITPLTKRAGPDSAGRVSPDGKHIAYLSFEDKLMGYQNVELNVMDADGSNARSLTTSLDRTVDSVEWAADGRSLYIRYDDQAITKVARVALNGRITAVARGLSGASLDRPYTGGEFSLANDGSIAFTSGSGARPSDVSIVRGGRARQLTALNEGLLGGKTLGEVRPLDVRNPRSISATSTPGWCCHRIWIAARNIR